MTLEEYEIRKSILTRQILELKPTYQEFLDKFYPNEDEVRRKHNYRCSYDYRNPETTDSPGEIWWLTYDYTLGDNREEIDDDLRDKLREFDSMCSGLSFILHALESKGPKYLRSNDLKFDHQDVLITDPCYVTLDDDWHKSGCGSRMEALGIRHYLTRDTIYGDWSCTVFNKDTEEKIGEFCADAGLVSVFYLDEVKAYNHDIEKWIEEHQWCATIIRDFTGIVYIDLAPEKNSYSFEVQVIGEGNINFFSSQTGL